MPNRSTPEYIPEEKTVADYILEINVVEFVAISTLALCTDRMQHSQY